MVSIFPEVNWQDFLCCPMCHGAFDKNAEAWTCKACHLSFPLIRPGIPSLLSAEDRLKFSVALMDEGGERMQAGYVRRYRQDLSARIYRALTPPVPVYEDPDSPPLPGAEPGMNLWLGAGGLITGTWINLDIAPFPGVEVVANACRIPFSDGSFDRVACLALLEHVDDPQLVVSEIRRVLKGRGIVDAVVPFCHPYHPFPSDFHRFSKEGLRHLFQDFENVEIGIRTGPTTTLLTFLTYYWKLIFPPHTRNPIRRWFNRIVLGIWGWTTAPLSRFDAWLNRLPDAHVLANHFYVRATKQRGRDPGIAGTRV